MNRMIRMSAWSPPGLRIQERGFFQGLVGVPGCVMSPVSPKLSQSNPGLRAENTSQPGVPESISKKERGSAPGGQRRQLRSGPAPEPDPPVRPVEDDKLVAQRNGAEHRPPPEAVVHPEDVHPRPVRPELKQVVLRVENHVRPLEPQRHLRSRKRWGAIGVRDPADAGRTPHAAERGRPGARAQRAVGK